MATTEAPAVQILKDARALLARRSGWAQGQLRRRVKGSKIISFCAIGALDEAYNRNGCYGYQDARYALNLAIRGVREGTYSGIADWNDTPGRKKSEVLKTFDRAIRLARRWR